mgnify:CR=1 FL=1
MRVPQPEEVADSYSSTSCTSFPLLSRNTTDELDEPEHQFDELESTGLNELDEPDEVGTSQGRARSPWPSRAFTRENEPDEPDEHESAGSSGLPPSELTVSGGQGMTDVQLARLLLALADTLDTNQSTTGAGIARQAARRLATYQRPEPTADRCRCGQPITHPRTGRRRTWCHDCRPRAKPLPETPENSTLDTHANDRKTTCRSPQVKQPTSPKPTGSA